MYLVDVTSRTFMELGYKGPSTDTTDDVVQRVVVKEILTTSRTGDVT